MPPPEVLFVSKPIAPPWNDGTKNLVRDLAEALGRRADDGGEGNHVRPVVCGRVGVAPAVPHTRTLEVYPDGGSGHALGAIDSARLLMALALGELPPILHFVAAPTVRAARAARAIASARGRRTVQTVASLPDGDLGAGLFADRVVVLSRWMEARVRSAAPDAEVVRIPPPLRAPLRPPDDEVSALRATLVRPDELLVLFAGDLGEGRGAEPTLRAAARMASTKLVIGARPKGRGAAESLAALHTLAAELGVADRVTFVGDTPRVHAYLAAADVVALPATDPTGKIDLPLVLLEAMRFGRPVLVADGSPAAELADANAAVSAEATAEGLAAALEGLRAPEPRRALGDRAQAYVKQAHDPDSIARAHETIYEALLP